MQRKDGRKADEMRKISMIIGVQKDPAGSVQVAFGQTVVLCAASVAEEVPPWIAREGKSHGWITGEYGMLPGSTPGRASRKKRGRAEEIQRLIGRALRTAADLEALGERTITVDCDVIQADGGTRTAAITGGYVAVELAVESLLKRGKIKMSPIRRPICAVSCVVSGDQVLLDPDYLEDRDAEVDMNYVLTEGMKFVEIQGTAEGQPFDQEALTKMSELAALGARQLFEIQQEVLRNRT
jgi:ribonuclease PH